MKRQKTPKELKILTRHLLTMKNRKKSGIYELGGTDDINDLTTKNRSVGDSVALRCTHENFNIRIARILALDCVSDAYLEPI